MAISTAQIGESSPITRIGPSGSVVRVCTVPVAILAGLAALVVERGAYVGLWPFARGYVRRIWRACRW